MSSDGGNQNICLLFSWPTSSLQYCLLYKANSLVKERSLPFPYEHLFLIMLLYRRSASCYQANIVRNVQTTYWAFDLPGLGQKNGIFEGNAVRDAWKSCLWTQKLMLLHDRWGIRKGIVHKMLNSTMCYQLFQAFRRVCWSVKEMRFYFTFCWGWQVCSSGAVYLKSQGVTDSRHTVS